MGLSLFLKYLDRILNLIVLNRKSAIKSSHEVTSGIKTVWELDASTHDTSLTYRTRTNRLTWLLILKNNALAAALALLKIFNACTGCVTVRTSKLELLNHRMVNNKNLLVITHL